MHGTLTINGTNGEQTKQDLFRLTIFDVIKQLKHAEQLKFTPAEKTGQGYFDIVLMVYRDCQYSPDEEVIALIPIFDKTIQNLFRDESKKEHLKNLGATDVDFALLLNNFDFLNEPIDNQGQSIPNIYENAKNCRFFDLWRKFYGENINPYMYTHISLKSGEKFPLFLPYLTHFETNPDIESPETCMVIIQDLGGKTWNYNIANREYKLTKPLFDACILYGDGGHNLSFEPDYIKNVFTEDRLQNLKDLNLKFLFFRIHAHDNSEEKKLQKLIEFLPDDIAQETVYFLQACHSGQYHKNWNKLHKNSYLITSAAEDESSGFTDYNVEVLNKYFNNRDLNVNGFVKFFNDNYKHSTPHISGNINGKEICNMSVKEYVTSLAIKDLIVTDTNDITEASVTIIIDNSNSPLNEESHEIQTSGDIVEITE